MLLIFPGSLLVIMFLLEICSLYEIETPINLNNHLIKNIFVYFFIILTFWVKVSNKWKKWALSSVCIKDTEKLESKINSKKTIVIRKWSDLTLEMKVFRATIIVLSFLGAIYWDYDRAANEKIFLEKSSLGVATVNSITKKFKKNKFTIRASYSYSVRGKEYSDKVVLSSGWFVNIFNKNGFQIKERDKFKVQYQIENPQRNRLKLLLPCKETAREYLLKTKEFLYKKYNDSIYCNCIVDCTYRDFGLKGISTLINQDRTYWENKNFNSIKYKLLEKNKKFRKILRECDNN